MRLRAAGLAVVLLFVALVLVALESAQRPPSPSTAAHQAAPAPAATPTMPIAEPERDIFAYADEPTLAPPSPSVPVVDAAPPALEPSPVASGPRLVGVLRRGGQLLAALAIEDDVVLVAPGQTVARTTVVAIEEDSVLVRLPDGSERTLRSAE